MTLESFTSKDIKLLFSGFSISPLFYNFLIDTVPKLDLDLEKLQSNLSFELQPILNGERVSIFKAYKLWSAIEKSSDRSNIGLIIADYFTAEKAGLLGELFFNTENLRESVEMSKRFLAILINNIHETLEDLDDDTVIFYFDIVPRFLMPFSITECYAKICYNWVNEYCGTENFPIKEINFYSSKPKHMKFYTKHFPHTVINFNQKRNYAVIKKEVFLTKNRNKNLNYKYKYLLQHAEKIKKEIYSSYTCSQTIINMILINMPEGNHSIQQIAEKLNISVSTIKRKLKNENTTFKKVTETIRKKLALSMIKDKNISYEEMSYLLGYSEYSPFFRAFKKWFKHSPSDY